MVGFKLIWKLIRKYTLVYEDKEKTMHHLFEKTIILDQKSVTLASSFLKILVDR